KINEIKAYYAKANSFDNPDVKELDMSLFREAGVALKSIDDEKSTSFFEDEMREFRYKAKEYRAILNSFRGNYKDYYKLKKSIIDPLGIDENNISNIVPVFNEKIEKLQSDIDLIHATKEERITRITIENEATLRDSKTPFERAREFASLNDELLSALMPVPVQKQAKEVLIGSMQLEHDANKRKERLLKILNKYSKNVTTFAKGGCICSLSKSGIYE
ncbi:MAG: hypothetical protein WCT77_14200, partial [Bacteroidota bacterium]